MCVFVSVCVCVCVCVCMYALAHAQICVHVCVRKGLRQSLCEDGGSGWKTGLVSK